MKLFFGPPFSRLTLFVFLAVSHLGHAQNAYSTCDCEKDFAFVTNYLENHYSGFSVNVTEAKQADYNQLKSRLSERMREPLNKFQCLAVLRGYTNFFRDNHLGISIGSNTSTPINESSAEAVQKFKESKLFKHWEKIDYDSAKIWNYLSESQDTLEGIYENEVYRVAVVKNQNANRDYCGIMIQSRTPLWERGQVKLEMKRTSEGYQTVLYMRDHATNGWVSKNENPMQSQIINFKKVFPVAKEMTKPKSFSAPPVRDWFYFKSLDDSTNYLYIGTFNGSLKSKFDSAYEKTIPLMIKKPNLIVDVRNNGGGSDVCWQSLAQLIYTNPFNNSQMELLCSPEIIKRYEEQLAVMRKNRKAYGGVAILRTKIYLKKIRKRKPGTFISQQEMIPWLFRPFYKSKITRTKQNRVHATPKKVILMFNRQSASSAEGLVLEAMHSKKVLTFGENSGGYITFGNVMQVRTPSGFGLTSGTHRVLDRFQYEKTGIPPKVNATNDNDWIEQARKLLAGNGK